MADEGGPSALLGELDSLVKDPKSTADFSAEVKSLIAQAEALKAANRIEDATILLAPIEKKARNAFDSASVSQVCVWIVKCWFESQKLAEANESILLLCRKRQQLKCVIVDIVQEGMKWLDKMPNKECVYSLIETLCKVTEGKMFVEVERARVILRLAKMKEAEGDLAEASALLQEVQIETSIAMEKHEKTDFILEQMRLVLAREDYVRCQIVSKRLSRKLLEADDFQLSKLRYYHFMVRYHLHEGEMMQVSECLRACLDTPMIRSGTCTDLQLLEPFLPPNITADKLSAWYLEGVVLFSILAPPTPEQIDITRRLADSEKKLLQSTPAFRDMLNLVLSQEVVKWPPSFVSSLNTHALMMEIPFPRAAERAGKLKERVVQHNLRVVAKYYKRCTLKRMRELFDIPAVDCELQLCELVGAGIIHARINRPLGVVVFGDGTSADKMVEWSRSISRLLDVVEEGGYLLEKDMDLH